MESNEINEQSKAALEVEKLALEVKILKRPVLFQPAYLGIFLALISAIASAYFSGIFDVKRERLEIEKIQLAQDIEKFEQKKGLLENVIDSLEVELSTMYEDITQLQAENEELEKILLAIKPTAFEKPKENNLTVFKAQDYTRTTIQLNYIGLGILADTDYLNKYVQALNESMPRDSVKYIVKITGNTDGSAITAQGIPYNGEYGKYISQKYYHVNTSTEKTFMLRAGEYIRTNEQLGLVRAYGLKTVLSQNDLFKNRSTILLDVKNHKKKGPEYRSIDLEIVQQKTN